ncbi:hypothetical protein PV783_18010 [Chitinophaga sp. CC14]|nr:hypothetical protein [Chitinophaga ginsengisegetis]MDR6571165.1 hypothetical protein [Chitinophaga ginsengisegetis]MDR6650899.1 hypothetical protein [Chitinophaga ginsengisegetis]MDR6657214.1 hypothetical protein [Chitinophaga ginsengisegetis]
MKLRLSFLFIKLSLTTPAKTALRESGDILKIEPGLWRFINALILQEN